MASEAENDIETDTIDTRPPRRVKNRFAIGPRLGKGGMGEVYRAEDELLQRPVALKRIARKLRNDPRFRHRLLKEARRQSSLSNAHIAQVHEFVEEGTEAFIVMEYVDGKNLRHYMQSPLKVDEFFRTALQCVEALAAAHQHHVLHGDIKPENIMLTPAGEVKILDFGLARRLPPQSRDNSTAPAESFALTVSGTPGYMAPEALRGQHVDARADIFSLGVVFYEMLSGKHPFQGETMAATIDHTLHNEPERLGSIKPGIPPALEGVIQRMLAKPPEQRYPDAAELLQELKALPDAGALAPRRVKRRQLLWAAVGTVLAVVTVLAAILRVRPNVTWRERLLVRAPSHIESLAVLPLENLSGNPDEEYFADGMTDELITDLGRMRALRVISRTSVMPYKGAKKQLPEVARELGVDAVVEGAVLRSGNRVRITAQLIQAKPERHLWAESYERDIQDVLSLQGEVAGAIVEGIRIKLDPQEESRLRATRSVKPDAYEAYLKGRYFWNKRDREAMMKGLKYFQQAIELDPSYAPAYAGLADSYAILGDDYWLPPSEAFSKAKAAAVKAVEIDDGLSEAHTSLGQAKELEWDWKGAETEYKKALALSPGYVTAHQWYSGLLSTVGRHEEAIVEARRASELDPLSPVISLRMGLAFYFARQYGEARRAIEKTLEVAPDFFFARQLLGLVYLQDHKLEESIAEIQAAARLSPEDDDVEATLGYVYALSGRKRDSQAVVDKLKEQSRRRYVSPCPIALVYAALGKNAEAFEWLEEAYKQRDTGLPWIGVEPMFDPLRSDPRFHDLLRRMNLPG